MSVLGNKIRQFATTKFGSLKNLSEELAMHPSNLQAYLKGDREPGTPLLRKLQKLGCDIDWLLSEDQIDYVGGDSSFVAEKSYRYQIVGTVPAGKADVVDLTDWIESEALDYSPDDHAILRIDADYGYSMTPIIQPGDQIMYSYNARVHDGDIVVARWDATKGAVKICNHVPDTPNFIALSSTNTAVAPIILERRKVTMYKVVLIIKKR